jgi:hypothetical protein
MPRRSLELVPVGWTHNLSVVMPAPGHFVPGVVPGTHVLLAASKKDVSGRDKPGHDELVAAWSDQRFA